MAFIKLKNVNKTFETGSGTVEALKDINLSIEKLIYTGSSVCREPERVHWYDA